EDETAEPAAVPAVMSAAAASAQYQRGAGAGASPPADDPWAQAAEAAVEEAAVDPNLAARAADRSAVPFDDPPAGAPPPAAATGPPPPGPPRPRRARGGATPGRPPRTPNRPPPAAPGASGCATSRRAACRAPAPSSSRCWPCSAR